MSKILRLTFSNSDNEKMTLSIDNCVDTVTKELVIDFLDKIKNVCKIKNKPISNIVSAIVVETTENTISLV